MFKTPVVGRWKDAPFEGSLVWKRSAPRRLRCPGELLAPANFLPLFQHFKAGGRAARE
jgi:hypothetical protein